MIKNQAIGIVVQESSSAVRIRDWQHWAPLAAVAWSIFYAVLVVYWAVGADGASISSGNETIVMGPLIERFGAVAAWTAMLTAGIPAAVLGMAMLRDWKSKILRSILIAAGVLLTATLLLLMTSLDLLIIFGYIPYTVISLFKDGELGAIFFKSLTQWTTLHQLLRLVGGLLWLVATVCYVRRSMGACLYCGRRDNPEGWTSPERAARWGRIAVGVAMVAPVFYALTRFAWAMGFPLGMSKDVHLRGQEAGTWISGLFLAIFGLAGMVLMLGLVQRWGEVFPRWMIGLAGSRVPIALAVIPASLVSVLLLVGGIGIWSGTGQMIANSIAGGAAGAALFGEIFFQLGPTLLFPVWGVALALATLAYSFRRRGPCRVCGR